MVVTLNNKKLKNVEKGIVIIRLAEQNGIHIPRFCEHPFLKPVAVCRQCLVEVGMPPPNYSSEKTSKKPNLRWSLMPACATVVVDGMEVKTNSPIALNAEKSTMEFLLTSHPLDCPVCDQGGECDLQDQAMELSAFKSRYTENKRKHFPKTNHISEYIVKDMDRCVLCKRCVRFGYEISGDILFESKNRGAKHIITNTKQEGAFDTNVVDICPVGALTDAKYRFKARPFELTYRMHIGATDSMGSATRVGIRDNRIVKVIGRNDKNVNDIWITDEDRFAFSEKKYYSQVPMHNGKKVSWQEIISIIKEKLSKLPLEIYTGDKLTLEDALEYKKLAEKFNTVKIDWLNGKGSNILHSFLSKHIRRNFITLDDVKNAKTIICVNFDPEIDGGVLFLKMFSVKNQQKVISVNNKLTKGVSKLNYKLEKSIISANNELANKDAIVLFNENISNDSIKYLERAKAKKMFVPKNIGGRVGVEMDLYTSLPNVNVKSSNTKNPKEKNDSNIVIVNGCSKKLDLNNKFIIQLSEEPYKKTHQKIKPDIFIPVLPYEFRKGTFLNAEGRKRMFNQVLKFDGGVTVSDFLAQITML